MKPSLFLSNFLKRPISDMFFNFIYSLNLFAIFWNFSNDICSFEYKLISGEDESLVYLKKEV